MKKVIYGLLISTILVNTTACGTIIYPERKGQRGGQIDAGIAVLDGIGLLFFLIPGIIAYAVDFSTGAIYLPGGRRADAAPTDVNGMKVIHLGKENLTPEAIEQAIYAETGKTVHLNDTKVGAYRVDANGKKVKMQNVFAAS